MTMDEDMGSRAFEIWEAEFRAAAEADACSELVALLRRFALTIDPTEIVEATVSFVAACTALSAMDGVGGPSLIDLQAYRPDASAGAAYVVTFNVCGKAAARVITDDKLNGIDFADLYEMLWNRYRGVGYSDIYLTRVDGTELGPEELEALERRITEDLRFDYAEDEVDFWFDPDSFPGALLVAVQDHFDTTD